MKKMSRVSERVAHVARNVAPNPNVDYVSHVSTRDYNAIQLHRAAL